MRDELEGKTKANKRPKRSQKPVPANYPESPEELAMAIFREAERKLEDKLTDHPEER